MRIVGCLARKDGNHNLEPHPPRTTSSVDRMTTAAREVTQQRKQPHAHGKKHDQRTPQSFSTEGNVGLQSGEKESAPAADREWVFLMHELL